AQLFLLGRRLAARRLRNCVQLLASIVGGFDVELFLDTLGLERLGEEGGRLFGRLRAARRQCQATANRQRCQVVGSAVHKVIGKSETRTRKTPMRPELVTD